MAKVTARVKRQKPVDASTPPARSALTVRLRNELRRDIERSAIKYGRSLSEEIENRLEVSLAFTQYIRSEWGDDVFRIAQATAASLSHIEDWTQKSWVEDGETYDLVQLTVANILRNYRDLATKADGRTTPNGDFNDKTPDELGQIFAALGGLAPPRAKKPSAPIEMSDEQREGRARGMANMRAILSEGGAGEESDT